jgi:phage protein D
MSASTGQNNLAIPVPDWQVLFGGQDITESLKVSATDMVYEDCTGKRSSNFSFGYSDNMQAMQNGPPTIGSLLTFSLGYQGGSLFPCGTFEVDEFELTGPPDKFTVKGVEVGITQAVRTHNTSAYENKTLLQIANFIALKHGFTVVGTAVNPDVVYARVTQLMENDIAFLHRIANQHNYDFNVRNGQLVFFSRPMLDSKAPVSTLTRDQVMKFNLHLQSIGKQTYQGASASYFDPTTKLIINQAASDSMGQTGDTLKAVERVENKQQAAARCAAYLYEHNMSKCGTSFTLPGTMAFRAGNTLNIDGWGVFDKFTFVLNSVRHSFNTRGWVTQLNIRNAVSQDGQMLKSQIVIDTPAEAAALDPNT